MAADVAGPATAGNPEHASLAESLHTVLTTLTQIRQLGAPVDLPELRERLVLASWLVTELSAAQDLLMAAYRSAGASWEEVAEATGRPAAEAQEAYARRLANAGATTATVPPVVAGNAAGPTGTGHANGPSNPDHSAGPTAAGHPNGPDVAGGPGGGPGPDGQAVPAGQNGAAGPKASPPARTAAATT